MLSEGSHTRLWDVLFNDETAEASSRDKPISTSSRLSSRTQPRSPHQLPPRPFRKSPPTLDRSPTMPQDMPPAGGYRPVQYKRNLPARGFRPSVYILGSSAIVAYGLWKYGKGVAEFK